MHNGKIACGQRRRRRRAANGVEGQAVPFAEQGSSGENICRSRRRQVVGTRRQDPCAGADERGVRPATGDVIDETNQIKHVHLRVAVEIAEFADCAKSLQDGWERAKNYPDYYRPLLSYGA